MATLASGVRVAWPAGSGVGAAAGAAGTAGGGEFKDGQQRLAAQGGVVGRGERADLDLLDLIEALHHDFHVGLDDGFAELAELLDVLLVDDVAILLLGDAELLEQGADGEECAEEGVALHAELQVAAVGGLFGDVEAGQREDADVLVDDLLARPEGQAAPRPARLPRSDSQTRLPPSAMPSSGLLWVKALGSQQRTTVTWRRSQLTRMRSLAATMK